MQEAELQKVTAKLGRMTANALNQLLDAFELPRGTGEEGHKVLLPLGCCSICAAAPAPTHNIPLAEHPVLNLFRFLFVHVASADAPA